jgi:hypothetical protein
LIIAKSRGWIENIRLGRVASLAEIAERENQCERHIHLLAPQARRSRFACRESSMGRENNTGRRSDICAQRASTIPYARSQD